MNSVKQTGWCETLYQQKAAELVLYGRALGLSHGEAEDVLQETFLALLRRQDVPSKAAHYCVRSYRNHALNYRRSLWRRLTRELESRQWFDRSAQETTRTEAAMRCLATLPGEQREVVVLKIWHDHTFEEIGELAGISPNTAAGRYRYAMAKLKQSLKGSEYEGNERIGDAVAIMGVCGAHQRGLRHVFLPTLLPYLRWIFTPLSAGAGSLLPRLGWFWFACC